MALVALGRRAIIAGGAAALMAPAASGRAAEVNGVVIGRDGWLFAGWESIRRSDPAMIARVADTLGSAIGLMNQAGMAVGLSVTPGKARIYREYLPPDYKWVAEAERRYDLILKLMRHGGTVVPDQASLFTALRRQHPDIDYWFKADTHWTGAGADEAAKLMASELKPTLHLPASSRPGMQLAPPADVLQERNDLASILPPDQRATYPFQHYNLRKPVTAGALLDDDTADVLVIGNSYMQPSYGYASVISEQLGRPDLLFWKVHQQSLYFTLLAYLKSDSFKKRRPKLVVWNMAEDDFEVNANNPGAWGQTAMPVPTFLADLKQALAT